MIILVGGKFGGPVTSERLQRVLNSGRMMENLSVKTTKQKNMSGVKLLQLWKKDLPKELK